MIDEILNSIMDEVVEAIRKDFSDPSTVAAIRDKIDDTIIYITGINIRNPFIYPHYSSFISKYQDAFLEILGIVASNPPESIDTTKEFIKEEVSAKVDTFADRLKQRLSTKENNHND